MLRREEVGKGKKDREVEIRETKATFSIKYGSEAVQETYGGSKE